ncbi:MAG: hypothetical protein M1834_008639 [Cirrosporium novae-zelandiae]|nr:MAG: hypothetical protein M1834_008639 [Cirrosporium novae-zelandiae]
MTQTTLPNCTVDEDVDGESSSSSKKVPYGHELRKYFLFDPKYLNLNHGSFGTYPTPVRSALTHYHTLNEQRPDKFLRYSYPPLLHQCRMQLSTLVHSPLSSLVLITNATTGINTVLRNLHFLPNDVIIYFSFAYGAVEKTIKYITESTPAAATRIEVDFPIEGADLIAKFQKTIHALRSSGKNPRIAIFDTIVSQPGVRLPFESLIQACKDEKILSCVDGAHGVGHIPLNLSILDPDFFTSNCHKWLFTPRPVALLYVPPRNQALLRSTLPTSHGFVPEGEEEIANPLPTDTSESQFELNFGYVGTLDVAPYLTIPAAITFIDDILGGQDAAQKYCRDLAAKAGQILAHRFGTTILDNTTHTHTKCFFSNVKLPLELGKKPNNEGESEEIELKREHAALVGQWIGKVLVEEFDTFVATCFHTDAWWVRLSGMVYLEEGDFEWVGGVLEGVCERVRKGEFLGK